MPSDIRVDIHHCRFESIGVVRRIYDVIRAAFNQRDVNHVTGDVHFLTYLFVRKRTVLTMLDCVSLERLRGVRRWMLWFFWYWLPSKRCVKIVVISNAVRDQLLQWLPRTAPKIKVIYCGLSDAFSAAPRPFNHQMPTILLVGTTENKNIERTVKALAAIRCRISIIGCLSQTQRSALSAAALVYDNDLDLTLSQLVERYNTCDIVGFASTYEGFGLPIIEANAVGRPVITSNVTSMPEIAGDAACLVDPFDVGSIRAGFLRVIHDEEYREALITRGFENVKRFKTALIAAQHAQLYRDVAKTAEGTPPRGRFHSKTRAGRVREIRHGR